MNTPPTQHSDMVVFRQYRWKLLVAAVGNIAFVALGLSFIIYPDLWQSTRHSSIEVYIIGWMVAAVFSFFMVRIAVLIVRPAVIKIGPEGIVVGTAWTSYSRPWGAVSDFKVWKFYLNRTIVFNDTNPPNPRLAEISRRMTGMTSALPGALNVSPENLLVAIEAARDRWLSNVKNARGIE